MQVSVLLMQQRPWHDLRASAKRWDAAGARALYVADHLKSTPAMGQEAWFDGFTLLGALSQVTLDIRLGTLVASVTLHDPVKLALATRSLDLLSKGRFELGIGAGGRPSDEKMRGLSPSSARRRADLLIDYAQIVERMLRGEKVDHSGLAASVSGAELTGDGVASPRPALTIAAHGPRTMDAAARYADAWSASGLRTGTRDEQFAYLTSLASLLDERLLANGRSRDSIRRSILVGAYPGLTYTSYEELIAMAGRLAAIGFDELVVYDPPFALDDAPTAPHGVIDEILGDLNAFESLG